MTLLLMVPKQVLKCLLLPGLESREYRLVFQVTYSCQLHTRWHSLLEQCHHLGTGIGTDEPVGTFQF